MSASNLARTRTAPNAEGAGQRRKRAGSATPAIVCQLDVYTDAKLSKACRMAVTFIHARFGDNRIGLPDLVAVSGMSHFGFIRKFRRELGVPPCGFLQHYRIAAAMRLLTDSNEPIWVVSHAVGYPSPGSFCRAFWKNAGVSPRRFRQMQRRAGAAPAKPVRPVERERVVTPECFSQQLREESGRGETPLAETPAT